MRKYLILFAIAVGVIAFFSVPQRADAARDQEIRRLQREQQVLQAADPSFFPLAPCPSCTNPTNSAISGSPAPVVSAPINVSPAVSVAPCDNSTIASDNARQHGKHKKHRGAISGGIEELFKFLLELIKKIIELLGGGPIQSPQTPQEPEVPEQPDQPDQPDEPDVPDVSQAPEAPDEPDQPDTPDPCDPANGPSSAPQPTQPVSVPSSGAVPSLGVSSAVPQPSGATADACVAPPGGVLQDQDTSDHQVPWKKTGPGKVVITFATQGVPAEWIPEFQKGSAAWNRSACIETKLVETCQPNTNCVPIFIGDGAGADGNFEATEEGGFTTGGRLDVLSTLTGGERTNVAAHEMGHAVGLAHRKTKHVLMESPTYDDVFDPDEIDFQNLLVIYGNQK